MYEPHLFQPGISTDLLRRLETLAPSSPALWGEMDVAQMLAHVAANLRLALNRQTTAQTLLGRLFGSFAKRRILKDGVPRNVPTLPSLKVSDHRHFEQESEGLKLELERFIQAGEAGITRQPHSFFGRLTPQEWARLQYVHIDHHFRQFGV
ncbi:DUF1569 domain-containing protein [Deinococcus koreensis]|uniref:DUF1569 domain-containing protein n=1 Tax=Deinococcus koreensis TaxID=2054903 RepID=A0A2K3UWQ1_9DEIO|nr:DUF1569 domain-containing protein [Deinococcus koreensis]PNY80962.1 hypothetical protein CVO96_05860 [Deinococcus koreensis]